MKKNERLYKKRLVDYICVVGVLDNITVGVQPPQLLRRFPIEDHEDFPLTQNVVSFCQPDGCLTVSVKRPSGQQQSEKGTSQDPGGHEGHVGFRPKDNSSFMFTLTDKDTNVTRFGVCHNFYRSVCKQSHGRQQSDEKTVRQRSKPAKDHGNNVKETSKCRQAICGYEPMINEHNRSEEEDDANYDVKGNEPKSLPMHLHLGPRNFNGASSGQQKRTGSKPPKYYTLTSICIISHQPFFSNFIECTILIKQLVGSCELVFSPVSGKCFRNARRDHIDAWNLFISHQGSSPSWSGLPKGVRMALHDIKEVEAWIEKLLSSPVPEIGESRVELELFPKHQVPRPPLVFALPDKTRFPLCDFPLHLPLELLGVNKCLQVLTLILLERKLVVQSHDYSALSLTILSLTKLIYPLEYVFPVIPLLPLSMDGSEQLLLAPTPYIIGVPSSFLDSKRNIRLPDDVWLIDLDRPSIQAPESSSHDLPCLPESDVKVLKSHLKQVLSSISIQPIKNFEDLTAESLSRLAQQQMDLESPTKPSFYPFLFGNDVDSIDVATRVAMVKFFNSPNMLADMKRHTRTLRLYPRPIVTIQMQQLLKTRSKLSPFMSALAATQSVECYAEWSLIPPNLAFKRVHEGVYDPIQIGDKPKWYAHSLQVIEYKVWHENSRLVSLLKNVQCPKEEDLDTDESGSDSSMGSSSSWSFSDEIKEDEVSPDGGYRSLPSDTAGFGAVQSRPSGESEEELPSPGEMSFASDISVAGSERVETSSERSTCDKPPTPTVAPMCSSPVSNIFIPSLSKQETIMAEEEEHAQVPEPTVEELTAQELFFNIEQLTLHAKESFDFSTSFKSAVNKERLSSVGKTMVDMTNQAKSKKLEFFKALTGSAEVKNDENGGSSFVRSFSKDLMDNLGYGISPPPTHQQQMQTTVSSPPKGEPPSNGNAIRGKNERLLSPVQSPRPLSPRYDITFPRSNLGDIAAPRPTSRIPKNDLTNTATNKKTPPPRPPPIKTETSPHKRAEARANETKEVPCDMREHKPKLAVKKLPGEDVGNNGKEQRTAISQDRYLKLDFNAKSETLKAAEEVCQEVVQHDNQHTMNNGMAEVLALSEPLTKNAEDEASRYNDIIETKVTTDLLQPSESCEPPKSPRANNGKRQQPYAKARETATTRFLDEHYPQLTRSNSTLSNVSTYSSSTHEIFSSISSDLSGLATQTSTLLESMFGYTSGQPGPNKEPTNSVMLGNGGSSKYATISADNHAIIKDAADRVLMGENVGWLKLNRLKRLMEEEMHRSFMLSYLQRKFGQHLTRDGHIEDLCLEKSIWKGVSRLITAVVYGLESTWQGSVTSTGIASAFQMFELIHTHYWSPAPNVGISNATSPIIPLPNGYADTKVPNESQTLERTGSVDSESSTLQDNAFETESETGSLTDAGSLVAHPSYRQNPSAAFQKAAPKSHGKPRSRSVMSDPGDVDSLPILFTAGELMSKKSSLSGRYRFRGGNLVPITADEIEIEKTYLFEGFVPLTQIKDFSNKERRSSTVNAPVGTTKPSFLWQEMQFWEDLFCDAVAQERDLIGMDTGVDELLDRYNSLAENEKRVLENDEDRLLSVILYNLTAFMLLMQVSKPAIRQKIQRLMGKCHLGLIHSVEINQLLDHLEYLEANDVDLKPLPSRQMCRRTFTVHAGTDATGDLLFMEVREDGLIIRSVNGAVIERWFYDEMVNMTFSPRNKVICLWRRAGGLTELKKYHTKKCRDLYYCIKEAMESAALRGNMSVDMTSIAGTPTSGGRRKSACNSRRGSSNSSISQILEPVGPGPRRPLDVGGDYPVEDLTSNEGCLLQVCMEGISLLFAKREEFIRLAHIRKCFTQRSSVFVVEEYHPASKSVVQRKFATKLADQICYSVLCVFSYVAVGQKKQQQHQHHQAANARAATASTRPLRAQSSSSVPTS